MTGQRFSLMPFAVEDDLADILITGEVRRAGNALHVVYELQGDLASVRLPEPEKKPGRRNGLWRDTCMECFLAVEPGRAYWEFNLSPSGNWNVFHFAGYREGMEEESALPGLQITSSRSGDRLALSFEADLSGLVARQQALAMGLNAVVRLTSGRTTFWGLVHTGPTPDFHRRNSFIMNV